MRCGMSLIPICVDVVEPKGYFPVAKRGFLFGLAFTASLISFMAVPPSPPPPVVPIVSTPFPDRLAPPTLPPNPSQADRGAYDYWSYCMVCHGDGGQGLTGEFRALYPPEDQNCWASGCHGPHPYENGWTLPDTVPQLIGPGSLAKFDSAGRLFAYVRGAMPYHSPGSLEDETYWRVVAFLLRENGVDVPQNLGAENAEEVLLWGEPPTETGGDDFLPIFLVAGALLGGIALFWARARRHS